MTVARVPSARRYYLLKRQDARRREDATEGAWQARQEAEPGAPLASDFPFRTTLAAAGYTTTDDLAGANETELVVAGLSYRQARAVLAAL